MLTPQRKKKILELLAAQGQVLSKQLSETFAVSEDTIRRDLRELSTEGLLQRVHGGALPASAAIATFAERKNLSLDSKQRLARKAAELIMPGQVVLIDGGTTTSELVKCLPLDLNITVVTHSPGIALGLCDHPHIDVVLIGGRLYKHSIVTVGAATLEGIAKVHADVCFLGVTGVHVEAGLTTGDFEESCIKRALAARAAETIVMASPEKMNTASPWEIGDISLVNTLVVVKETEDELVKPFVERGIGVVFG
ncbi:DeoR/GlpR family DNA-binding transcription regulator [Atlantibacter sp.]|uniref:DeoR/GlpR family DNA-binding transcription regulator n=1 Tax=Atlantibacter sp. TaxID=1903473 RepID=UPI0028B1F4F1|nr:DeoR/GlpR family DNA-binding transcription regulator [Atlantibacter sp.]